MPPERERDSWPGEQHQQSGSHPQQGYPSGGYPQPGHPQPGPPSGSYPQPGPPSGGYPQQGPPSGGYPQPGPPSGGYPQQGPPSGGYQQQRYAQQATGPQAPYGQPGQYADVPSGPRPARPQPRFTPSPYGGDGYDAPAFRNPRTGSDYHRGDDYTMPSGPPPGWTPGTPGHAMSPVSGYPTVTGPANGDDAGYMLEPGGRDMLGPQDPGNRRQPGERRIFRRKRGRIRRVLRKRPVQAILAVFLIFFGYVAFSLGQALTASNGLSLSEKLAEWGRDHYLGPVVTWLEQQSYTPPKNGGKPQFALTDPGGKVKFKKEHGFKPDIPANLTPFASPALQGEGVWHVREIVRGEPALFTTFMRVDAYHTSYVAGFASFDQRLTKFQLHPGSQDPGSGFGGGTDWIAPGQRTGLLATFNSGFRLSASRGGFYLNGSTSGTLTSGAASVVIYRDGSVKVGEWGRDLRLTGNVMAVRQNLRLIIDHGQIAPNINQDVESNFGATIGGQYYVWRSGIGQTADGRIVYVYGPSLSAASLAALLQRAGAVEGMELDINPDWTSFEYYSHGSAPTPTPMLPDQQSSALRYYSPWARDFLAVYAK